MGLILNAIKMSGITDSFEEGDVTENFAEEAELRCPTSQLFEVALMRLYTFCTLVQR
jgi:hypothetical protein